MTPQRRTSGRKRKPTIDTPINFKKLDELLSSDYIATHSEPDFEDFSLSELELVDDPKDAEQGPDRGSRSPSVSLTGLPIMIESKAESNWMDDSKDRAGDNDDRGVKH